MQQKSPSGAMDKSQRERAITLKKGFMVWLQHSSALSQRSVLRSIPVTKLYGLNGVLILLDRRELERYSIVQCVPHGYLGAAMCVDNFVFPDLAELD